MSEEPKWVDGRSVFDESVKRRTNEEAALDRIRKEAKDRAESGLIGGVREWFDIAFLLRRLDEQGRVIDEARKLADQGVENSGSVNAYRLRSVLGESDT